MDLFFLLTSLAWIAIVALVCSLLTKFWIAMAAGAVLSALLIRIAIPVR
jgi:hypothetical protein